MNILKAALQGIENIIKKEFIMIKIYGIENINGVPFYSLKEDITTKAHIQCINPLELKKITESTLNSDICYKFFILEALDLLILNGLNKEQAFIIWNDATYKVYINRNNINNGWICLYGTLIDNDFLELLEGGNID